MDKVSLIIVSKSDTEAGKKLLKDTINTALLEPFIDIEVIVVDNHYKGEYIAVKQPKPFNYNACLNAGAKVATGNYYFFANNDLLFKKGSLAELVRMMQKHRLGSASARCPIAHSYINVPRGCYISYKVRQAFAGWGFMLTKEAYNTIGGHREDVRFYCSDNITVEQLKEAGILHGLVKTTFIEHIGQQTQKHLDSKTYFEYCYKDVQKFNKLYNQNIFNIGHGETKN